MNTSSNDSNSDRQRVKKIADLLTVEGIDALLCATPSNVLLVSGYWPVVGTSMAIATRSGAVVVIAPQDEEDLARAGWADHVRLYSPGSINRITGPVETIVEPLSAALQDLGLESGRVAIDDGPLFEESTYSAAFHWRASLLDIAAQAVPQAELQSGVSQITALRSALTSYEVRKVGAACQTAGEAYRDSVASIVGGSSEAEIAAAFGSAIAVLGHREPGARRVGGYVWCMSGPNSAKAGAAYARTTDRKVGRDDLVLIHCNSYVDGYWTDITRTYHFGRAGERVRSMYEAIFRARDDALEAIRPGVLARDVDRAARNVLREAGFGDFFTHGLGHNVGFSAISSDFPPRIHPASSDRLAVGATFNIEPAIYISGFGGIRHCDVVTVTEAGPEVLTPFYSTLEELSLAS